MSISQCWDLGHSTPATLEQNGNCRHQEPRGDAVKPAHLLKPAQTCSGLPIVIQGQADELSAADLPQRRRRSPSNASRINGRRLPTAAKRVRYRPSRARFRLPALHSMIHPGLADPGYPVVSFLDLGPSLSHLCSPRSAARRRLDLLEHLLPVHQGRPTRPGVHEKPRATLEPSHLLTTPSPLPHFPLRQISLILLSRHERNA